MLKVLTMCPAKMLFDVLKICNPHVTDDTMMLQLLPESPMCEQIIPSRPRLLKEGSGNQWLVLQLRLLCKSGWRKLRLRRHTEFYLSSWL